MKNHLLHLIALLTTFSLIFMSCKKEDKPITWPTSLGNASFASNKTWTISNGTITQIWSDAVQTVDCSNKTIFDGGLSALYNIDCRSNPGQKGDLFSWRAVSELKDELCPEGWRVPTIQDFIDLDIALGGTGQNRYGQNYVQFITDNYLNRWGGTYGGECNSGGTLDGQDSWTSYWSQSEGYWDGYCLHFGTGGVVNPGDWYFKNYGFALRCVR
ncbi:MAG: fibrobacter succinogenes major paralogous domain-containing protein [Bacteroidales bacterium]|nr:fibrobacter succinogenes major paralogous domain-containing protein [Bacteroidales bacterium]